MDSKILGLRTTIYKVNELAIAKIWYSKVFKKEPYFDEPFYIGFNIKGYELGLLPDENSREKADSVLTYWGVEEIHSEFERFLKLGAKEHEAPHNVGGDIMVGSVKDPWGNIIGLIYNPHFELPK